MEQKTLSRWLKWILIGVGFCGLVVFSVVIPICGLDLRLMYPEFSNRFWPWLIFLWASGVPCFAVLVLTWRIAANIGRNQSFSEGNARLLQWISRVAAADAGFFFIGNVLLLLLNMSHPGIVIASLIVVFAGIAVSVASAVLSHLVKKAADLQEQSDWTI